MISQKARKRVVAVFGRYEISHRTLIRGIASLAISSLWLPQTTIAVGSRTAAADTTQPRIAYSTYVPAALPDRATNGFPLFVGHFGTAFPSVAIDRDGATYVAGSTTSPDENAPLLPTTAGAFQVTYAGGDFDGFMVKLVADGSAPAFVTYLGGEALDVVHDVAVAPDGSVWVVGETESPDFPRTVSDQALGGVSDGFVAQLSADGTSVQFGMLIGGSSRDQAYRVAFGPSGDVYVAGSTASVDFPATSGAFQTSYAGNATRARFAAERNRDETTLGFDFPEAAGGDAFVVRLSPRDSNPRSARTAQQSYVATYATYLGGVEQELTFGLAVDDAGAAYLSGMTRGGSYPTTEGSFQEVPPDGVCVSLTEETCHDDGDCMSGYCSLPEDVCGQMGAVCASDTDCDPVATCERVGPPFTPVNGFVTKLSPGGDALVYSTFLGGRGGRNPVYLTAYAPAGVATDHAMDVAVGADGSAVVVGTTAASSFPFTEDALKPEFAGCCDPDLCEMRCSTNADCTGIAPERCEVSGPYISPYVARLTPDGDGLVYAALYGPNPGPAGNLVFATDIAMNRRSEPIITGLSIGDRIPEERPLVFPYEDYLAGFVAKLTEDGRFLTFSTRVDGAYGDAVTSVAVTAAGDVHLAGYTASCVNPDGPLGGVSPFPITEESWLPHPLLPEDAGVTCHAAFAMKITDIVAVAENCAQPVTSGALPLATDCLFVLRAAIGREICEPDCICDTDGNGTTRATDALRCLYVAVRTPDVVLACDCREPVSMTTSSTSTTTIAATTGP